MAEEQFLLRALRKEDFFDLTFKLVNVHREGDQLKRTTAGEPALLVVGFPPQHMEEEVYRGVGLSPAGFVPSAVVLSGKSRLVFQLPIEEDSWAFNLETLLDWPRYQPVLVDRAGPTEQQTAIELPTGLYLSPDKLGKWLHSNLPVGNDGYYELWQTHLNSYQNESSKVRMIWTTNPIVPFLTTLTQPRREEIVKLTSDFAAVPNPVPVDATHLMLSALGGSAQFNGVWNPPPGMKLEQWQQIITQGRNHYVKVVERAILYPTGHRVSLVEISERRFELGPASVEHATAYLKQQTPLIIIQEPEKDYGQLDATYQFEGREMPLKEIKILNTVVELKHAETTNGLFMENPLPQDLPVPFWPMISRTIPFFFDLTGKDLEGHTIHFQAPLVVVPGGEYTLQPVFWKGFSDDYNSRYLNRRTIYAANQLLSFAETDEDTRGKTSYQTESFLLNAQPVPAEKLKASGDNPVFFLPVVHSAKASIPAVNQLLGKNIPIEIAYSENFLQNGFLKEKNQSEVFLKIPNGVKLPIPPSKGGGLLEPETAIDGLSRTIGTVKNEADLNLGKFDTKMFEEAALLGGIKLMDILLPDAPLDPEDFDIMQHFSKRPSPEELDRFYNDPNFLVKVPLTTLFVELEEPNKVPIQSEMRFLWKPEVKDFATSPPFLKFLTRPGEGENENGFQQPARLLVDVKIIKPLKGGKKADYHFQSFLKHFSLNFAGAMKIGFEQLSFVAKNGKKTEVSAEGQRLEFIGPLKFVDTIRSILPADGFSDPPYLDINATGIKVGYTLGIPTIGVGIFSLQNINLSAGLSIPLIDQPAGVRFAISEREKPFLVTVGLFGGGGFFSLALSTKGIEEIEASIEFGGSFNINLVVASGGVEAMAGIYFGMFGDVVKISGYFRCRGFVSVAGIVSISIEISLELSYVDKGNGNGEVAGKATLKVTVEVLGFSKSFSLSLEKRFAGAAGDPTFADLMGPEVPGEYPVEWEKYCHAFA